MAGTIPSGFRWRVLTASSLRPGAVSREVQELCRLRYICPVTLFLGGTHAQGAFSGEVHVCHPT